MTARVSPVCTSYNLPSPPPPPPLLLAPPELAAGAVVAALSPAVGAAAAAAAPLVGAAPDVGATARGVGGDDPRVGIASTVGVADASEAPPPPHPLRMRPA